MTPWTVTRCMMHTTCRPIGRTAARRSAREILGVAARVVLSNTNANTHCRPPKMPMRTTCAFSSTSLRPARNQVMIPFQLVRQSSRSMSLLSSMWKKIMNPSNHNPVLVALQQWNLGLNSTATNDTNRSTAITPSEEEHVKDTDKDATTTSIPPLLPDFSQIQPHHFQEAAQILLERDSVSYHAWKKGVTDATHALEEEDGASTLLHELDQWEAPRDCLIQMVSLMFHMHCHQIPLQPWTDAMSLLSPNTTMDHDNDDTHSYSYDTCPIVYQALQNAEQQLVLALSASKHGDESNENAHHDPHHAEQKQSLRAIQKRLRDYRHGGMDLMLHPKNKENLTLFHQVNQQLSQLQSGFLNERRSNHATDSSVVLSTPRKQLEAMYQVLQLQTQKANLLGYSTWAELSLQSRMASGVDAIAQMHESIRDAILLHHSSTPTTTDEGELETDTLSHDNEDDVLDPTTAVRPYLNLDSCLNGLFKLCRALFGIDIVEAETETVHGWHSDVRLFHVLDDTNDNEKKYMASFYLDPFRRLEKSNPPHMGHILHPRKQPSSSSLSTSSLVYINCDVEPPMWDDAPAHLTFDNLLTLYHEFGHALHYMLADVKFGTFSGAHKVEEDFSELPSQFMEQWLLQADFLKTFAFHVDTGEPIPSNLAAKLIQQYRKEKTNELSHRAFLGQLELELHSTFDPHGEESIIGLQRRLAEHYLLPTNNPLPPKSDLSPLLQIFESNAKGKSTAHYRYLWSDFLSADCFAAFQEAGFTNETQMKQVGRKFRKTILEAGDGVDPVEAFRNFRGRDVDPNALLKQSFGSNV